MAGFKAQLRGPKYYARINNIKRDNKGITRRERVDLCFLSKTDIKAALYMDAYLSNQAATCYDACLLKKFSCA